MTVLVDEARWLWRGRRWAHLVSDDSYDELHEAARRIGKRRLGFQGDHYDIDEIDRQRALMNGAEAVDSRSLVRRLRTSGLRRSNAKPEWVRLAEWADGTTVEAMTACLAGQGAAGRRLGDALLMLDGRLSMVGVALFADTVHLAGLIEIPAETSRDAVEGILDRSATLIGRVDRVVVGEPRAAGDRSIELFVAK